RPGAGAGAVRRGRDVVGGLRLQLLLGARQPPGQRGRGARAAVGGPDAGDGRGPDRPPLGIARGLGGAAATGPVERAAAPAPVAPPRAAPPEPAAAGPELGSLITVACGTTVTILSEANSVSAWKS